MTAEAVGSGDVPVLATPAVLALVEQAAVRAVEGRLPHGRTSVGSSVPLDHGAAPPERVAPAAWSIEGVDTAGDAGSYDSLALNGANQPRISYSGDPQLRFAYKDATGWHRQTVDSAGFFTSLALDRFGHPFVSY